MSKKEINKLLKDKKIKKKTNEKSDFVLELG